MAFIPGYRSPLCPVPEEIVPDTTIIFNSERHDETDYKNTSNVESCINDGYCLEVVILQNRLRKRPLISGLVLFVLTKTYSF